MPRLLPIAIVALTLVIALGLVWSSLTDTASGPEERSISSSSLEDVQAVNGGAEQQLAAAPKAEEAAEESRSSLATAKSEVVEQAFTLPSDAHWFDGRVVFPPELPMDESFEVEARGQRFGKGKGSPRKHTVRASQDGRFRIAFSKQTKKGWLSLRARYMYLEADVKIDVEKQAGEIVLEPLLGGVLRGVVAPPPSFEATEEVFDGVCVTYYNWESETSFSALVQVKADGSFEFEGLPPAGTYELRLTSPHFGGERRKGITVLPGEVTEIKLALTLGVHIAGRVVSASGEPVRGAKVVLRAKPTTDPSRSIQTIKQETKQDGSFEFSGISPCSVTLKVQADGALEIVDELGSLVDGDRRTGLFYSTSSGQTVNGRVSWQDGEPAVNASVEARPVEADGRVDLRARTYSTKTDEQGLFEFAGLDERKLVIDASASRVLEDSNEKTKAAKRKQRSPKLSARIEDVEPGTRDIQLVLGLGGVVRGSVLHVNGSPVGKFRVEAEPDWMSPGTLTRSDNVSRTFDSEDGEFELTGLKPGAWRITASSESFAKTEDERISVPFEGRLDFMVEFAASLTGMVQTPAGEPLADALVIMERTNIELDLRGGERAMTDGEGVFTLDLVEPGDYALTAKSTGWAPSTPLAVSLAPAEERTSVVLTVAHPCTVTGVVLPGPGGIANRHVAVWGGDHFNKETATSDELGELVFKNLGPGHYQAQLEKVQNAKDHDEASGSTYTTTFTVVAGESTHFEIGAEPEHPIRIYGVVTSGGSGVKNYSLKVKGGDESNDNTSSTDESGGYSLLVDGPGKYKLSISSPKGSSDTRPLDFPIEVTGEREQREDFELPTATITLKVLRPDGRPAPGVLLHILALGEGEPSEYLGWEQQTDSRGQFTFKHLAAGTYSLRAGGSTWWNEGAEALASQFIEVQLSEGEARRHTVQLEEGGSLHGTAAFADGTPAAGLPILAVDSEGRRVSSNSIKTDSAGRFKLMGMPAGELRVRIEDEDGGPSGETRVHLSPGGEADVLITAEG